jgi:3-oxoacyl-[acyl-carrier protein] reductase
MILKDKVIVVTGGTGDLGRPICMALAREGANIAFSYFHNKEKANSLEVQLQGNGVDVLGVEADLRNFQDAERLVELARKKFGGLDGLVNCAGINRDVHLIMMKTETWHEVIETNLSSVFNCCKASAWVMVNQKHGCIVNVASVSGLVGVPTQSNYSASKAGMIGFTKSLSKELGHFGIRVNAVAPGLIESSMVRNIKPEILDQYQKIIPLKRLGKGDEVAEVVIFLLSDSASYITGQTIVVDGGFSA